MRDLFEERVLDLTRKGDVEKVKFLKNLHKKVMPSQIERIQEGDKTVLAELFLPKWLTWDFMQIWASRFKTEGEGRKCNLCAEKSKVGIDFDEKFICNNCYMRIKHLDQKMVE